MARNRNNFKHYLLSTPREKNKNTGNISVNMNDLANFDKDFLFNQYVDGELVTKVISKEYVRDHIMTMYCIKEREDGTTYRSLFYAIKLSDILAA